MTPEQVKALYAPAPLRDHDIRKGYGSGNKTRWFVYVNRQYAQGRLDDTFPGNWSTKIGQVFTHDGFVALVVSLTVDGITREDIGEGHSMGSGSITGDTYKSAVTSGFRKVAASFGIGIYLYDSVEIYAANEGDAKRQFAAWYDKTFCAVTPVIRTPTAQEVTEAAVAARVVKDVDDRITQAIEDPQAKALETPSEEPGWLLGVPRLFTGTPNWLELSKERLGAILKTGVVELGYPRKDDPAGLVKEWKAKNYISAAMKLYDWAAERSPATSGDGGSSEHGDVGDATVDPGVANVPGYDPPPAWPFHPDTAKDVAEAKTDGEIGKAMMFIAAEDLTAYWPKLVEACGYPLPDDPKDARKFVRDKPGVAVARVEMWRREQK